MVLNQPERSSKYAYMLTAFLQFHVVNPIWCLDYNMYSSYHYGIVF
ncbi:prophage Lp2 protein 1 [Prevotella pallens ATCC 700821]|uniref:Prophage Lp2 protein 1 n=1 Tax=Prevotella pallens ATCC 700821 TaxID=997353 RepID=F9DF99_9BACT|nr:prophage Lp2 protein 1 [Prevotella pallens ATCC 700821]